MEVDMMWIVIINAFDDVLWDCYETHIRSFPSFHFSCPSFSTTSNNSVSMLLFCSKWMQTMTHSGNNFGPIIAQTFRMCSHWCQRTRYEPCARIIRPIWRHCATKRPNDWSEPLTIVVAHIPNNKQVKKNAIPGARCTRQYFCRIL